MRAVIVQRKSQPALCIEEVRDPRQGESEALVAIELIAINPGEIKRLADYVEGARIGWDFAGTVIEAAPDGSGPRTGARVVGTTPRGGWAERVASPVSMLAEVPDDLELEIAVCLPVPAMTAYTALAHGGMLLGKRVLLTGAAGAVGQYACQLAELSGADVSAAVRREDQVAQVTSHGISDVRITDGIEAFRNDAPFDIIVDVIGTGVSDAAVQLLSSRGVYAVVSAPGGDGLFLPATPLLSAAGQLRGISLFDEIERGPQTGAEILSLLVSLAATGHLTAPLGPRGSWEDIDEIARVYLRAPDRAKPVLRVNRHAN